MPEYFLSLALTIGVELGIAFLVAPRSVRRDLPWAVLFVNLLTHPLAHVALGAGHVTFLQVEVLVVLVETVAYVAVFRDGRAALRIAVPANLATAVLSFFV